MTIIAPPSPQRLLRVDDLTPTRFDALLELGAVMKRHPLAWRTALAGRAVACLFEQRSTRSRVSFEVAIDRLGAMPIMLRTDDLQLGRGEPIADTARVLSAYCDAIVVRTPAHRDALELAEHASVPVVNALSDSEHPCQALADCLTLRERFGDLHGLPVAYVGDCTGVAHSLIQAAILTGLELRIAAPRALLADPALLGRAGTAVRVYDDPADAVDGACAVYTSEWRGEAAERYRVTDELMRHAAAGSVFMHSLPARRGCEVEAGVIDGPSSAVWEQVANLVAVEQALLRALVTGDWEV
jgi:ornithine carbamoyltransferase